MARGNLTWPCDCITRGRAAPELLAIVDGFDVLQLKINVDCFRYALRVIADQPW
jgi:hypothetical protein